MPKRSPINRGHDAELVSALEWLARAAIGAGIDANTFLKAARRAIALAGKAELNLSKSSKKVSYSQVAALTGLARKELPELLLEPAAENIGRDTPTWSVLHHWLETSELAGAKRRPKILSIDSGNDSFKSLVKKVVPDVPHMSVLKELERMGLVERRGDKTVALREKALAQIGKRLAKFSDVTAKTRVFGRSVYNSKFETDRVEFNEFEFLGEIPEKMVGLFMKAFAERATSLLAAVGKWRAANVPDSSIDAQTENVGLGIYLTRETNSAKNASDANPPRKTKRRAKRA